MPVTSWRQGGLAVPLSVLAERYEMQGRIGSGGMATVWRAFDRRLSREVAIKVLHEALTANDQFRQRFEREARHIASFSHPNIVVVHDFGTDGDRLFIVMELVRGRSLRTVLAESTPLEPAVVTDLAIGVLAGLGHAHESGILHRDIKPGNVLVTETGVAKLADFGIAKATEETVDLTDSGTILGTVTYASPEQLSGDSLGPASDLYSLGCVLYECLAGRPPFVADSIAALVSQQQFARPQPLKEIRPESPEELRITIMRALEKSPARRFATANEMEASLGRPLTPGGHAVGGKSGENMGAKTETITVLFCDVVGSTALQSAIGDDAADEIRRKLFGALVSVVEPHKGTLVKTLGDGMMVVFRESAVDALHCAIEMTRATSEIAEGLAVRVGVSHGEVSSEEGDWFGTPVVEAARLESAAQPGAVLATPVVRVVVGSRGSFVFDELSPITLKGLPGSIRPVRVREAESSTFERTINNLARHLGSDHRFGRVRIGRRSFLGTGVALLVLVASLSVVIALGFTRSPPSQALLTEADIGYTPKYVPVSCPSGVGNGAPVTCGDLIVPQDRTRPRGRQIRLLIVRAPAESSHPASDPVVELGREPGTTTEGTSSTTRLYSNYIGFSLRGGDGSTPVLSCPEVVAATTAALAVPPRSPQWINGQASAYQACRARLVASGIDPDDYGADATAADFRDLLSVLRVNAANMIASDAESFLAFDIMRKYPRLVRSASIEDGVPPGFSSAAAGVANLWAALNRYTELCNSDAHCHATYPDLLSRALQLYPQLQASPVTVTVSVEPGLAPSSVLVNGDSAAQALNSGLLAEASLPLIPSLVYSPNPAIVAEAIAIASGQGLFDDWGEYASLECKDILPGLAPLRRIEEQAAILAYPALTGVDNYFQLNRRMCQVWNVRSDDPNDSAPIVSDIPTFLFGGALNPASSPTWTMQMAQGLSHAHVAIFPTLTDDSLQTSAPACLVNLRLEFFRNPTVHLDTAGCVAQSPPIAFVGS